MINVKQFVPMLALCLTATLGYSQDRDSEYVAPVHPVPRGEAPGMKVQKIDVGRLCSVGPGLTTLERI